MANETTYTTLDDLRYATILNEAVMDALASELVCAPFVRNESLAGEPSIVMNFPKWPSLTAAAVNEATDLTNTAVSTTTNAVTVGENGFMATLTDVARDSTIAGRPEEIGRLAGEAIGRKIDADIFALFSALNGGTVVGTTTADLTVAQFLDAIRIVRTANAKPPYVFFCHPIQAHDLRTAIQSSTGTPYGNVSPEQLVGKGLGYEFTLFGVDIYSSTQSPTANAGADQVGGVVAIGQNSPIALVTKNVVATELQRDASLRATEVVTVANYGVGEIEDAGGVGVVTDA